MGRVDLLGEVKAPSAECNFPLVQPAHECMQKLLANAMGCINPSNDLIDESSGYPVEDFVSYEELVSRFSEELMEFIK